MGHTAMVLLSLLTTMSNVSFYDLHYVVTSWPIYALIIPNHDYLAWCQVGIHSWNVPSSYSLISWELTTFFYKDETILKMRKFI